MLIMSIIYWLGDQLSIIMAIVVLQVLDNIELISNTIWIFWYKPTVENFHNVLKALADLNVDINDLRNIVFDRTKTFLKNPHEGFHRDFLPVMADLDSYKMSKAATETVDFDGVSAAILSLDDLITNKRLTERLIKRISKS